MVEFAKTFLDSHSLESLYYGNLSKDQARELTDLLVGERADYLERRAGEIGATVEVKLQTETQLKSPNFWMQVNPNLADWFAGDPVERIVNLENSLLARKREVENYFDQFLKSSSDSQVCRFSKRWRTLNSRT